MTIADSGATNADPRHFRHSIRVAWADCDPARIAYTGRIPYFALEAIDAWWEWAIGLDWFHQNIDRGFGTPFVHMSLDFRSPITPRHRLVCEVRLIRLGNSSVRFAVDGYQDGTLCFEGQFVETFVQADSHKASIPVPGEVRARLEALLQD